MTGQHPDLSPVAIDAAARELYRLVYGPGDPVDCSSCPRHGGNGECLDGKNCTNPGYDNLPDEDQYVLSKSLLREQAEKVIMAAAPMTAPDWTTKPPTEPGWYWTRYQDIRFDACGLEPVYYDGNTSGDCGDVIEESALEWYPIPIPEPPRKELSE